MDSNEDNASNSKQPQEQLESCSAEASNKSSVPIVDDPELDAILNDALLDFGKVPTIAKPSKARTEGSKGTEDMQSAWTEEFIKEATSQFEKTMRERLQAQQGGGSESVDFMEPSAFMAGANDIQKVVEVATKAAVGNVVEPSSVMSQINEAMKNFTPDGNNSEEGDFSEQELTKLMNSLSMGGEAGDGDEDLDEFLPFMTNFMQKLLSKDLLYPVLSDIVDRYPEWLADNRPKLSAKDFDNYNQQYGFMKQICEEYASETPTDNDDTKRKRYDKVTALMLKVQCCGTPPKDLVGEDGAFPNMDPSAVLGNLAGGAGAPEQCTIM